jgi:alpha-N-arabinofuranosidase
MRRAALLLPIVFVLGCDRGRVSASGPERAVTKQEELRASPGRATVAIDATSVLGPVSPLLFGMHIEWVENGNGLLEPDRPVLRSEVLELLRPLRVPVFRFPGGIHADYYDWTQGAGDSGHRGSSKNAFNGQSLAHRFGTPELLELLEETGGEALLTANYGTGSAEQASAWAKYLRTRGARARLWEVGNEIYLSGPRASGPNGKAIYRRPEEYAKDFPRYRSALRAVFPDALVGAIGHLDTGAFPLAPEGNRDWTLRMLKTLEGPVDFLAVHNAYAPVLLDDSASFADDRSRGEVYRSLYAGAAETRENLDQVLKELARLSPANANVPLAVTEFGPLFGVSSKRDQHAIYVDQSRTLAAALYVASLLDVFLGEPRLFLACYTNPIHRWYGSLLTDTEAGLVRTPTYYLYSLYRSRFESGLVPTVVTSPTFDAQDKGIVKAHRGLPDLLARASLSADGSRLTALLVNRSLGRPLSTAVSFAGFAPGSADCLILTAPSPASINGPGLTATTLAGGAEITPKPWPCPVGNPVEVEIPPNTILSLVAERAPAHKTKVAPPRQ